MITVSIIFVYILALAVLKAIDNIKGIQRLFKYHIIIAVIANKVAKWKLQICSRDATSIVTLSRKNFLV